PVDIDSESSDARSIARTISDHCQKKEGGIERAIRYVAYLGGRFCCIILVHSTQEVICLTDCAATVPIYWSDSTADAVAVSTHASLCARIANTGVDEGARSLLRHAAKIGTRGTLFPPGLMTGYSGIKQVIPNHALHLSGNSSRISRYYPFEDTTLETDGERSYRLFESALTAHTSLLSQMGRVGFSLTGGRDSRATLSAATKSISNDPIAWTYYNSRNPKSGHVSDLAAARDIAARAEIEFTTVDMSAPADREFARAVTRTMGATAQMIKVPIAYNAQLPGDIIEMQSMAAEIATGFYRRRSGSPTVERLARLYTRGQLETH